MVLLFLCFPAYFYSISFAGRKARCRLCGDNAGHELAICIPAMAEMAMHYSCCSVLLLNIYHPTGAAVLTGRSIEERRKGRQQTEGLLPVKQPTTTLVQGSE